MKDPELKQQFDTVTIDTIGLLYDRCEAYICDREGVDKIGDVPYGAGFKMVDKEFEENVRKIIQILDDDGKPSYGLCLIGHDKVRVETDGQISITHITPDVTDRCAKIINRMVDLTAYIGLEDNVRYIYPRQVVLENAKNKQITEIYAGSHFASLNDKIELGYDNLVNAIADAMEYNNSGKKIKLSDAPVSTGAVNEIDFKKVKSAIGKIARTLNKLDEENEESHYMEDYKAIVDKYLGKNKLVKDSTEAQAEHLQGILDELQDYLKTKEIVAQ